MNIYELTGRYREICDAIDAAETPEEVEELLGALESVEDAYADKAAAYAHIMINYKADAEFLKSEKQRLEARQKAAERVVERLKQSMLQSMTALGAREVRTDIGAWRMRKNPPSVEILSESEVPKEYRIPQPDKIDKAAMLKWFKETGEILPGIDVRQTESVRFV